MAYFLKLREQQTLTAPVLLFELQNKGVLKILKNMYFY